MAWFDKGDLASFRRTAHFFSFFLISEILSWERKVKYHDSPFILKRLQLGLCLNPWLGFFSVILSRLLLVRWTDLPGSEFAPLHKSSKSDYLNGKYLTLAPLWHEVVPHSKDVYTKSVRMIHSGEVSHRCEKKGKCDFVVFHINAFSFFFFVQYAQSVSHCLMCILRDL